jgi:hypothetical protein
MQIKHVDGRNYRPFYVDIETSEWSSCIFMSVT